jgi:hypothetical protein
MSALSLGKRVIIGMSCNTQGIGRGRQNRGEGKGYGRGREMAGAF